LLGCNIYSYLLCFGILTQDLLLVMSVLLVIDLLVIILPCNAFARLLIGFVVEHAIEMLLFHELVVICYQYLMYRALRLFSGGVPVYHFRDVTVI